MIYEITGESSKYATSATVVGYGYNEADENYVILLLQDGQKLNVPLATFQSIPDWPLRSKVRFTTFIEKPE